MEKVHIAAWVEKDSFIHKCVTREAKEKQVSISAIIRWALLNRYGYNADTEPAAQPQEATQ